MSVLGAGEAFMLASGEDAAFRIERSLRFDRAAGSNLSKTFSSSGNTKKFTWSFWFKGCDSGTGASPFLIGVETNNANRGGLYYSAESLRFYSRVNDTTHFDIVTQAVYRDPSAWYHCVIAVDVDKTFANGGFKLYINGVDQPLTANLYTQGQALHWNTASAHAIGIRPGYTDRYYSGYMADIHFVDGQQLDPDGVFGEFDADTGVWNPKRYSGSHGTNGFHLDFSDNSSDAALGNDAVGSNNWTVNNLTAVVSDTSQLPAPANIAYGEGTGTNQTWQNSNSSSATPSALAADYIYWVDLGSSKSFNKVTFDVVASGQTTDTSNNFIVYFSTSHSSLGSSICNNCGIAKEATRTGITPGTISVDFSGFASQTGRYIGITNGHGGAGGTYTYTNFDVAVAADPADIDSLIDTPTDYEADSGNNGGNYATFNPLDSDNGTLSNGNLTTNQTNTGTSFGPQNTTIGVSSGKWYCEIKFDSGTYALVGITHAQSAGKSGTTWHRDADTYTWYFSGAFMSVAWPGTSTFPDGSNPTFTAGDVVGVLLDKDNDKLYFTKNGSYVASMNAATGANGIDISAHSGKTAFITCGNNASTATQLTLNAGQRPFAASSIPTGYKPLCTQSFDDPLIADPSTAMDVKTWSGNSTERAITGYNFSPDFAWIKTRSTGDEYVLSDNVRGAGKVLSSSASNGESDFSDPGHWGHVKSFDTNGFTVDEGAGGYNRVNLSGRTYVGWAWDGGDLVTNSAYNQSQTWSSSLTSSGSFGNAGGAPTAFDGSTSTLCQSNANSETLTFAPSGGIAYSTSVEVYTYASHGQFTTTSDGAQTVSWTSTYQGWKTIASGGGTFTSTVLNSTSTGTATSRPTIAAIRVDGKLLVDAGVIPAGSLNSSLYNQSERWRDALTSSNGFTAGYEAAKAFDGVFSSGGGTASQGGGATLTFQPANALTVTSLELECYSDVTLTLPDGTTQTITGTGGINRYRTANIGSGFSFTGSNSITVSRTGGHVYLGRIKINGKELVDDDVTINAPSVASTVRANQTAGFSIVTYTYPSSGTFTVGHGLNATPGLIISKHRNRTAEWYVWHNAFTSENDYINLDTTSAKGTATDFWGTTVPGSYTFGGKIGTSGLSGDTDVVYCFAPVEGYSAFGTYEGNGNANGPFVFTGMRPKWILLKNMDTGGGGYDWVLYDTVRDTYNVGYQFLCPNSTSKELRRGSDSADKTDRFIDILSNGFKIRNSNANYNASAETFLWAAFAEHPFKTARAR